MYVEQDVDYLKTRLGSAAVKIYKMVVYKIWEFQLDIVDCSHSILLMTGLCLQKVMMA